MSEPLIEGWATAPVTGDRIDVSAASVIAGDPLGARIEIGSTGLHAFNGVGTETARIDGEEGVFVGGEFRTSDALPGQVTLADDAYVDMGSGNRYPGIGVTPLETSATLRNPGIGPNINGMVLSGGQGTNGNQVYSILAPNAAQTIWRGSIGDLSVLSASSGVAEIWADDAEGSRGYVTATPLSGAVVARDTIGVVSMAGADTTRAMLYTRAGGTERSLTVDANGVWVKTNRDGAWEQYNLEETAQDSGWQALTLAAGIASTGSPAWRNKGGVIYYRGTVTNSTGWAAGWNLLAADVTAAATPAANMLRAGASSATNHMLLQVTSAGRLEMWLPASLAGSTTVQLSPMFYPLG